MLYLNGDIIILVIKLKNWKVLLWNILLEYGVQNLKHGAQNQKSVEIMIQQDNAGCHAKVDDSVIIKTWQITGWNIISTCKPPNSPNFYILDYVLDIVLVTSILFSLFNIKSLRKISTIILPLFNIPGKIKLSKKHKKFFLISNSNNS